MSLLKLLSSLVVLTAVSLLLWLWARGRPSREEPPPPQQAVAEASPTPAPAVRPPTAVEAQHKLDLAFKSTVVLDLGENPPFVTGDFNSDGSMDLAAAVKPRSGGLSELNGEMPAWLMQDVTSLIDPRRSPPPPIRIVEGQPLLAIVHGLEADGWRHPDAQQGYLLVKARGHDMRTMSIGEAVVALRATAKNPRLGDVLAQVLDGRPGFVAWAGNQYLWRALPQGSTVAAR
jgi:hypothetical protein